MWTMKQAHADVLFLACWCECRSAKEDATEEVWAELLRTAGEISISCSCVVGASADPEEHILFLCCWCECRS